ncbi:hypothetical protein B566_EDAN015432 [Ephemera danica]|nr:hypothetical protein B566_EDAN015432 [Ephemera danica]
MRVPRQVSRTIRTNRIADFQRSDSESSELMALANSTNKIRTYRQPKTARAPSTKDKRKLTRQESTPRPQTATLERPRVLDTTYLTKLDMSLTRKALLSVTNLCKVPVGKRKIPLRSAGRIVGARRLKPRPSEADESWEDESVSEVERPVKEKKTLRNQVGSKRIVVARDKSETKSRQDTPNAKVRNSVSSPCRGDHSRKATTPRNIPEPCRSCGRTDLPERLHSHPKITKPTENNRPVPAVTITRPVKSSVQRPVPIKFRSEKSKAKTQSVKTSTEQIKITESGKGVNIKNTDSVSTKIPVSPKTNRSSPKPKTGSPKSASQNGSPRSLASSPRSFVVMEEKQDTTSTPRATATPSTGGPRLLVCYLCGREFGTASLPLHEPRCLEKWERLNARLPPALQRSPPQKPSHPLSVDEWNEFAWKSTQAQLVPCDGCGRTFLPDRLPVHRRSCKAAMIAPPSTATPSVSTPQQQSDESTVERASSAKASTFLCYVCGRNFGSRSLAIHEPQCLRRWKAENERLPSDQRRAEPQRGATLEEPTRVTPSPASPRRSPQSSASPPALTTCHICGRNFGTLSLPIHEPQCLRKWRQENDKLPLEKRRPEPRKPDMKYTENGVLDHEATFHAIWQSHLEQLVPCKACGRTFFPDRLEVHSRSCIRDVGGRR